MMYSMNSWWGCAFAHHHSKCQNAVYSVSCSCSTRYVGETVRNLKTRTHEHTLKSSKRIISLHVENYKNTEQEEEHKVLGETTTVITQEKNPWKWRFIESICIKSKVSHLCNTGTSMSMSDMWNPVLPLVVRSLSALDWLTGKFAYWPVQLDQFSDYVQW